MGIRIGIFHNTSGLITRGLGELHKLLTRGLGPSKKIIKGPNKQPAPDVKRKKEYCIEILSSISKTNLIKKKIYAAIKRVINKNILLKSNVQIEVVKSINLKTKIDHNKLSKILDAI